MFMGFESLCELMPLNMRQLLLPLFLLLSLQRLAGQDVEDPSLRKPYNLVVQTGISLQWFETQYKAFTLSIERPLNLYNHFGVQANFFFANDFYYYNQGVTNDSWEVAFFSKSFFRGRLTGRRSNAYIGPDMRFGRRHALYNSGFDLNLEKRTSSTVKILVRMGWQYHLGRLAVLEFSLPIGLEWAKFRDNAPQPSGFFYYGNNRTTQFVATPLLSLGVGF